MQEARCLFSIAGIKLTTDGQRHHGAATGTSNFCAQYTAEKVTKWCNKNYCLVDFAKTQPHTDYSAFTHSILSQYTYFMRKIPEMHKLIKPVGDVIRLELLLEQDQTPHTLKTIKDAKMPGASWRLGVLRLTEFGFALNKGQFRDARGLRCGRPLKGLHAKRSFGKNYNVKHALNCKKGGFVTMRNNNLRDFEADMLSKIVNDVETKPELQLVTGEIIENLSGNASRPNIKAKGVESRPERFFDVKVINTHSPSQIHLTTESILKKYEQEKRRNCNRHIMKIEYGIFIPLFFFFWLFLGV